MGERAFFVVIALLYTSNMTLMLTPKKWRAAYSPHGLYVNLWDASVILHFLVAWIAVSGVVVAFTGLYVLAQGTEYGRWLLRLGALVFIGPTGVQSFVGVGFLFTLPAAWQHAFLSGNPLATGMMIVAVLLALGAMVCMLFASYTQRPGLPALAGAGARAPR